MRRFWSHIWICVNLAVAATMVFCAYGGMVSPLRTTVPSLAAMTFPGWLILTIILVIWNLFRAKGAAAVNIISLLLCWGPISTFYPLHREKDSESPQLTLMSYNVMQLGDYSSANEMRADNPTLEYILSAQPDIAALQECPSLSYAAGTRLSRQLTDSIKKVYPFSTTGPEGQALLSRYPFEEIKLHYPPEHHFQVRAYHIVSPLGPMTLFNIHLQSIGLTDDDKELYRQFTDGRAARQPIKEELSELRHDVIAKLSAAFKRRAVQAARVKELIDSIGGPIIVCGDFNDIPGCYACREILSSGLKDAYAQSGFGPAITYHASRFYFRIDHIFYSSAFESLITRKESNPSSDHYPIIATLTTSITAPE